MIPGDSPDSRGCGITDDGSGGLDCEEFTTAVRAESGLTTDDVSDADMKEIFSMIDDDGSGAISATEFAEALCKDEAENYKMTFDAFERSMFELMDHWADGASEKSYTRFFGALFRSIVVKMNGVDGWDAPVLKTAMRQGGESNYILKHPDEIEPQVCINNDECFIQNHEFCIQNAEFCIQNDEIRFKTMEDLTSGRSHRRRRSQRYALLSLFAASLTNHPNMGRLRTEPCVPAVCAEPRVLTGFGCFRPFFTAGAGANQRPPQRRTAMGTSRGRATEADG